MKTFESIFSSFCEASNFWIVDCIQNLKCILSTPNNSKLQEGQMWKMSKKRAKFEKFNFFFKDGIFGHQKQDGKIAYVSLENCIIHYEEVQDLNQQKPWIRIQKGCNVKYFYCPSNDEVLSWVQIMKKYCILASFDEDYELLEKIGEGQYATVYKARSNLNNKLYATKIYDKSYLEESEQHLNHLLTEISFGRVLDHSYIVPLIDVYESEYQVKLVYEFVKGGDLFERLNKRKIYSEKKAAKLIRKFLKILVYLEKQKLVHGDIKLENIFLTSSTKDTSIKLGDFGLCQKINGPIQFISGTPGYIAPEILRGDPVDYSKVDIFAAGIILYNMLSGSSPFDDLVPETSILEQNKNGEIEFSSPIWAEVSSQAIDMIRLMTHKDPKKRISASEALKSPWVKSSLKRDVSPNSMDLPTPDQAINRNTLTQTIISPHLTPGYSRTLSPRICKSKLDNQKSDSSINHEDSKLVNRIIVEVKNIEPNTSYDVINTTDELTKKVD